LAPPPGDRVVSLEGEDFPRLGASLPLIMHMMVGDGGGDVPPSTTYVGTNVGRG